ncbi:MAG: hypothetical protein JNL74_03780 [Fibrobacteres bacterium]|nr:hypothetical protein [Fibrobacterota bacterium]
MFNFQTLLTNEEQARYLNAARQAGNWLSNTQNTVERPWGVVRTLDSADKGRYLEKCNLPSALIVPAAVWIHGISLFSLINLSKAPLVNAKQYLESAMLASKYLATLHCTVPEWEKAYGGFHEFFPGDAYSAPRDGATGAMTCISLYKETGEKRWLDMAIRFAQWYTTHGSDPDGYPWDDFLLDKGEGTSKKRGDWQAAGALLYWQLYKLTKKDEWKDCILKILDVFEKICANDPGNDTAYTFHGDCVISIGNDDFANVILLVGYRLFKEKRYLELYRKRMMAEWDRQSSSGAFPGYGGTFVTALEMLDLLEFQAETGIEVLPTEELKRRLLLAGEYTLTLQNAISTDRWVSGGVYGESNFGLGRDIIHARDTAYGVLLWLQLAGFHCQEYSSSEC